MKMCKGCGESFQPAKHNQIYCLQTMDADCEFCPESFQRKCGAKLKRTCSKSCSSKLIRKEQAEKSTSTCLSCGDAFQQKISAQMYCGKELTVDCESGCGQSVSTICERMPKRFCTPSCRQLHMRATTYSIGSRDCEICGESFVPLGSKALVCNKGHVRECALCEEKFVVNLQHWKTEGRGIYCDNICSTLTQMNSKLPSERVREYKDIDDWALRFKVANKRKPTSIDVRIYFGIGIPVRANSSFFRLDGKDRSNFELHVLRMIQETWPHLEVLRNKRPLRSESEGRLEIDLWVPELSIGFEVQDFATHSRDSDSELSRMPWTKFKNGPTYHQGKQESGARAGIRIFEIWEDEILSGQSQFILESAIVPRLESLSKVLVP